MNVHISYKIEKTADLEKLLQQQTDKLNRLLQVFRRDLVHLKGVVEEIGPRQGFVVSLNLRLPSGQMASQERGSTLVGAVKAAFGDLTEQLKRHKQLLRNHHKWPRRRGPQRAVVGTVPFEQTMAAVKPEPVSPGDISSYIDANLPRLQRFVQRELAHRESEGQLLHDQVLVDDVIGEAIANALGEQHDKPERMRLEPWLYRLSLDAIGLLASPPDGDGDRVSLQQAQETEEVDASLARFSEPEEVRYAENSIVDAASPSPEDMAARNETIDLVQRTLRNAGREPREAFILYTIEGFTVNEIADISNHPAEEVRAAIGHAREHLQRTLPIRDPLKDKLVEYAETA